MSTLIAIHGMIRWLVALVAVVAIVKFVMGWLRQMPYAGMDRGLMSGYTGLLDLNFLLGLIILIFGGGFTGPRVENSQTKPVRSSKSRPVGQKAKSMAPMPTPMLVTSTPMIRLNSIPCHGKGFLVG